MKKLVSVLMISVLSAAVAFAAFVYFPRRIFFQFQIAKIRLR